MLDAERHEEILTLLNNPDIEQSVKVDLLTELRTGFTDGTNQITELSQNVEKLTSTNNDLLHANSKLFRQVGIQGKDEEQQKEEEEKTFSETITLEQLEKGK